MALIVVYSFSPIIYIIGVMPHVNTTLNSVRVGVFLFSWCLNLCGFISALDDAADRTVLFFSTYPALLLMGISITFCRAWQLKRRSDCVVEKSIVSPSCLEVVLENDQAVDEFIKSWKRNCNSTTLKLIAGDGLTEKGCNLLLDFFHKTKFQLLCLNFSKFDVFPTFLVKMSSILQGQCETLELRNNGLNVEIAAQVIENLNVSDLRTWNPGIEGFEIFT